jgi:activating signal cointegrator complex subunit 1
LTLISDSEIDQAVNLLEECRKTFIKDLTGSKPLKVRIKGLEYMNDDPSEVDVLYAKVEPISDEASSLENSAIQKISDALMQKFVASGLSKKQYDRVKLHATIMNSLMTTDPSGTSTVTRKANKLADRDRESFDARNILKLFGDFDFGTYVLNEIHLSIRYSSGSDGFYDHVSKISFK